MDVFHSLPSGVIFSAKKVICGWPCEIINYSIWRLESNLCGRWDWVINPNVGKALLRLCVLFLSHALSLCASAFLIEFSGVLIKPPSCQMLHALLFYIIFGDTQRERARSRGLICNAAEAGECERERAKRQFAAARKGRKETARPVSWKRAHPLSCSEFTDDVTNAAGCEWVCRRRRALSNEMRDAMQRDKEAFAPSVCYSNRARDKSRVRMHTQKTP